MKLSILIPTLNEPIYINGLNRLKAILDPQIEKHRDVELRIHDAGRAMPTGTKRNQLIANSEGEYFVQIDSDDVVPSYYVDELLNAITYSPDVISFVGDMYVDNANRKEFTIKLGSKYTETTTHYYRFPNHLCCYKRATVGHVKFPDIWQREDYEWAVKIQHLLKTEVHIDKHMYSYMFNSRKNSEFHTRRARAR